MYAADVISRQQFKNKMNWQDKSWFTTKSKNLVLWFKKNVVHVKTGSINHFGFVTRKPVCRVSY